MLKINEANNETNNLGIKKVGHLYENIKFDCDDKIQKCSDDFHSNYLAIIKNAVSGNYDSLNQLIDDTFDADVKVLEETLKDSKNLSLEAKKNSFLTGKKAKSLMILETI